RTKRFDCLVLDLRLPDMSGIELLEKADAEFGLGELPVVVYTGKGLTPEEEARLRVLSRLVIPKDPRSTDRLLAETDSFLSRVETEQGTGGPRGEGGRPDGRVRPVRQPEPMLEGK